jgi:hypothetical protein
MSETSQQIFARSLPIVSNPPSSTTRSPDAVRHDKDAQKVIIDEYITAVLSENNGRLPLDTRPLDALHYVESNFIYELRAATLKGNK